MRSHHPNPRSTLSGSAATPFSSLSLIDEKQLKTMLAILSEEIERRKTGTELNREFVPVEIFSMNLAPAEALVKYLKENSGYKFSEMSRLLGRDERGLWSTYKRACKKRAEPFDVTITSCAIPIAAFSDRKTSHLESLSVFLHDIQHMDFRYIAKLLKKSYSTIYTCYRRAKKKIERNRF